jgi:hypothetical protein
MPSSLHFLPLEAIDSARGKSKTVPIIKSSHKVDHLYFLTNPFSPKRKKKPDFRGFDAFCTSGCERLQIPRFWESGRPQGLRTFAIWGSIHRGK